MSSKTTKLIKEHEVKWVDLRFTDTQGKEQHVSLPHSEVNSEFFELGKMFDGSSIAGWKGINESDMLLMPDDDSAVLDPFTDETTLNLRCNVVEPLTMQGYDRDPRSLAMRAEEYLKSTGIADTAFFGPEPEFFVFDDVKWESSIAGASYAIQSEEAAWASSRDIEGGNIGHRPRVKGGYFPYHRWTLPMTYAPPCVALLSQWDWPLKYTTTKWVPLAKTKLASNLTP